MNKEDFKYFVYKHTFPNNKVYIGVTRRLPEVRWGSSGVQYYQNVEMWKDILLYGWGKYST